METLLNIDKSVSIFIRDILPHNYLLNSFFSFFSLNGSSIIFWLLVIIAVLIIEEKHNPGISLKDKRFLVTYSLAFLLTYIVSEFVLKNIFLRPRPVAIYNNFQLFSTFSCPTDFSFPSTHAATAFASATVLTHFDQKHRWFYYLTACLISYSRIFLNCHYLFDILAGWLIGSFISRLLIYFTSKYRL